MQIQNVSEEDYYKVINVLNEWWGGREMKIRSLKKEKS